MNRRYRTLSQSIYARIAGIPPETNVLHFQHLVAKNLKNFVMNNLSNIPKAKINKLLDVGCGGKPYKKYIGSKCSWIGLDLEENEVADIKVQRNDQKWPLDSSQFDYVLCTEVLEHCLFPEEVINEITRVLKPSGRLFLTTPFMYPVHGAPSDYRRFTPHYFQELLKGMQIDEIRFLGGAGTVFATSFLNWIEYQCQIVPNYAKVRVFLLPLWLALAAVLNFVALVLDRLDVTNAFGATVAIVATKKS